MKNSLQYAYKTVVCIPAGRKRYLKILIPQLLQQNGVDEIQLWKNTSVLEDVEYIDSLVSLDDRIKIISKQFDSYNNGTIGQFINDCCEKNTVYIRMDDDIVFLETGLVEYLANARWNDKQHFLLSPCIINNAIVSWILQENNKLPFDYHKVSFDCFDDIGWKDPIFAEKLHRCFLSNKLNNFKFSNFEIEAKRYSVNCISWLGDDFLQYNVNIPLGEDEEEWLTVIKPRELNKKNLFIGKKIACHFAFFTQREYLETTNLLPQYTEFCRNLMKVTK
jgi:hypothetical protein